MTENPVEIADGLAGRGSPPRMPRWVKVLAIIVGVLILLSVLRVTGLGLIHGGGGDGGHEPRHGSLPASGSR